MKLSDKAISRAVALGATLLASQTVFAVELGDGANKRHIEQSDIDAGRYSIAALIQHGRHVFADDYNAFDGFGDPARPGVNSVGIATGFNRVSGPDSVACAACHGKPFVGGGGDNSVNIFPGFNRPDNIDIPSFDQLNVRNSQSIFGAGPKEVLAEEMNAELQAIVQQAQQQAAQNNAPVSLALVAKGIGFGQITALPDGSLDTGAVEGVDRDLIIRPFNTAGVIPNLRMFTIDASEQHFGIQAEERFAGDADGDGVSRELTTGDVTASALFMAALPIPVQVLPQNAQARASARRGERVFDAVGCTSCHVAEMPIDNPVFSERAPGSSRAVNLDLTRDAFLPRLRRSRGGGAVLDLYSDLKRHDMGSELSEPLLQVDRASTQEFLTTPLWGVASTGPWLHDGRATTLTDAILLHGGEAEAARDEFAVLRESSWDDLIEFLQSMQIVVLDPRLLLPNLPLPEQFDGRSVELGINSEFSLLESAE